MEAGTMVSPPASTTRHSPSGRRDEQTGRPASTIDPEKISVNPFRQLRDSASASYTYLLGSNASGEAVLVDPVAEQVPLYLGLLGELGLRLAWVVDTHLHADHRSAAADLRRRTGARVACSRASGIGDADCQLQDGDQLQWGGETLAVLATPGHTPGCLTLRWGDRLFTGDALLIGGCGNGGEPGGNAGALYDSVTRRLLPLADELLVFPGHDRDGRRVSCIGDERQTNPLFSGVSRDEFIALAHARQVALPPQAEVMLAANRRCGDLSTSPLTSPSEETRHDH